DVPRGIHILHVRLEVLVGDDAPPYGDRRALQEIDVHLDAQADAQDVALDLLAFRAGDAAHLSITAMHLGDLAAIVDVHARGSRDIVDQRAAILVEHAPQKARAANQPRHGEAVVTERLGQFVCDIAATDDHGVFGGVHPLAYGGRVVPVLEVVDA